VLAASVAWHLLPDASERATKLDPREGYATTVSAEDEARIEVFCSDCHALPQPRSFVRSDWHARIRLGYEYYGRSGRTDLDAPPIQATVAYYTARAAETLDHPQAVEAEKPFGVAFRRQELALESGPGQPALAHLCWSGLSAEGAPMLLASDMASGEITATELPTGSVRRLARLESPCLFHPCDLDQDGQTDLVVGDLGGYTAMAQPHGRVVGLRQRTAGDFEEVVLAEGLGRVADARAADFDGDGDLDLVVAEFGWELTGNVVYLNNVASGDEPPRFEARQLDPRPGAICVPIHDFNGDERPDFVALISQEHECVTLFMNQGEGRFHQNTLWRAPDLAFGSSMLELADLDSDGDADVLYVNGDAFDNNRITPWHGLGWLENRGDAGFERRQITHLAGACRARVGDFDRDGDQDIVLTAFVPTAVDERTVPPGPRASVLMLEQTSPGEYARHTLETGTPNHAAIEAGDFDKDGDLDFAVGVHRSGWGPITQRITIWWAE